MFADNNNLNFDRIAAVYESIERLVYGNTLVEARTALLQELDRTLDWALLIGDGDGRFLQAMLTRSPEIDAVVVEPSEQMRRVSQRRNTGHGRATWVKSLAEAQRQEYQLITTHFVFDVMSDASALEMVKAVSKQATNGANWMVAEFREGPESWKWCLVAVMYLFFRMVSGLRIRKIPDYAFALESHGWSLLRRRQWWRGFIVAELWIFER